MIGREGGLEGRTKLRESFGFLKKRE